MNPETGDVSAFFYAAMNTEIHIQIALCNYLRANYPAVIFTSDLSGVRLPIGTAKRIKPLKSTRGIPDLLIFEPRCGFHGLMIEIKESKRHIIRKDGSLREDQHIEEQSHIIGKLRAKGYAAFFICDLLDAITCIDNYMVGRLKISNPDALIFDRNGNINPGCQKTT